METACLPALLEGITPMEMKGIDDFEKTAM